MSDYVLSAKHWQIFLLTLGALFLMNLTIDNYPLLSRGINAVGYCLYFIWFAILGDTLFPFLPPDATYNLTWFLLDVVLVAAAQASLMIVMDGQTYHAEGIAALPIFYLFFAMVHAPWFLAASLVAVEKKCKPEFGFYFGTLLLFLLWPIGLWVIQPRLNKLWERKQRESRAVEV